MSIQKGESFTSWAPRSLSYAHEVRGGNEGSIMTKILEGKVALITGSDSGIGQASAIEFARQKPMSSSTISKIARAQRRRWSR